jgi:predicted ABC-type sugar transport system permease subunit
VSTVYPTVLTFISIAVFFGSAARFPHVQGMFAELFIASEEQCVGIPESTSFRDWQLVIKGAVIILAVMLDKLRTRGQAG